jgi:hypothetical protein
MDFFEILCAHAGIGALNKSASQCPFRSRPNFGFLEVPPM